MGEDWNDPYGGQDAPQPDWPDQQSGWQDQGYDAGSDPDAGRQQVDCWQLLCQVCNVGSGCQGPNRSSYTKATADMQAHLKTVSHGADQCGVNGPYTDFADDTAAYSCI